MGFFAPFLGRSADGDGFGNSGDELVMLACRLVFHDHFRGMLCDKRKGGNGRGHQLAVQMA